MKLYRGNARYLRFVSGKDGLSRFFAFYQEIFKNILHLQSISVTICDTIGILVNGAGSIRRFPFPAANCLFYIIRRVFMWNETGKGHPASEYQQVF